MPPSVGKFRPDTSARPLYRTLSFILSTALVVLPVLPARVGLARAASGPRRADALRAAPAAPPAIPLAGGLSATKVDSFADPDGDGKAEPGDTVTYTVTVTNSGPDATNVQFTDTVDPNTTLVPGSVATQPVAAGDSYSVLGNVRISVPDGAGDLLANDRDPDTGNNSGLSVSAIGGDTSAPFSATTANGGTVTAAAGDGSFSYNPPAGFEGTDSFTYTVSDGTSSDTATATFNVSGMVWFVDNSAASNGDGRLTSPFNSLAPLNGAGGSGDPDDPSDVIFVHQGSGSYAGGIALEDAQRLVGQGTSLDAALAAFGINVPPHSDARPAAVGNPMIENAGGNVVTLADGNTVMYVNAGATAAGSSAVAGGAVGGTTVISHVGAAAVGSASGITLANVAGPVTVTGGSVVCNSSGAAVAVGGGSAPVSFVANTVTQNGGHVVDVHGRTGGAVSFDAASTVTGTNGTADAVTTLSNGNSSVTFAGPVHLNTNATGARGVVADSAGGFTLNMTNAANTVSSTGGAAVDLENLAANLAFATTFSTDSNGRGLRVDNVSGSASFGNTAVNNSANTGVLLTNNAASVAFADLDIAPAQGARGLHATDNTGTITSASGTVATKNQTAVEVAGASPAARTPLGLTLTSVSATAVSPGNPPNGIVLTNTDGPGAAAGFVVTGDAANDATGSAFSGGSVGNTVGSDGTSAGVGVYLSNADEVTLRRMHLSDNSNFAVRGSNVSNVHLEYCTVNGVNGTTAFAPFDEAAVAFDELTGTASVEHSVVQGGVRDNVRVVNTAGVLDRLTFDDFTEGPMDLGNANGNDGLFIQARNNAVVKVSVLNSRLTSARGDILQLDLTDVATGELVFKGNTVNNTHPFILTGGGGITLSGGGAPAAAPTLAYDIGGPGAGEGNSFRGARGDALLVVFQIGHGSATGRIRNNVFGVPTIDGSGASEATDIDIRTVGRAAQTVLIDGNQIFQYANKGIVLQSGDINANGTTGTVGNINATVTNNTISNFSTFPATQAGMDVNLGTLSGDTYTMCLDVRDNDAANAGDESGTGGRDFLLRQRQLTTMKLPGYGGANNDNAAVIAYVQNRNVGAESVLAQNSVAAGGGGFVPGSCAQPAGLAELSAPAVGNGHAELAASGRSLAGAGVEAGFSSESELAAAQAKLRRGLANSENGQVLAAATIAGEARAETARYAPAAAPAAAFSGGTFTVNIGTLKSGDSVTITFQATVESPFDGAQPQVSNQGTVTADGGISALTDDPSVGANSGETDPTVTPILLPPSVRVNDATVAEPASGTANMLFTVALSNAYTHDVTVSYETADNGSATAGDDYATASGSVTFTAGQTVQTVSVPVNADGTAGEGSETFLVNLSNPSNATIGDGQATGTITDETIPSPVIISELRTSGPAGAGDDFVELLNTTDADVTVPAGGWSLVAGGAGCSDTPVVVASIPAGTVIPARGNYLLTGSAYSLGAYAAGDAALSSDIQDDGNVGLFAAGDLAGVGSANRLDAVGFGANAGGNCDLLREGNNLPAAAGSTSEYSFVRKVSKGLTQDTTDNAADFVLVSTAGGSVGGGASTLGAPGPEGSAGPRGPVPCSATSGSAHFGRDLLDPSAGVGGSPNVVRGSAAVANGSAGTIEFRRTFKNNTAANVTALRFRVVDLSTKPAAAGAADLRALSSGDTTVGVTPVKGTTLQVPPAQAAGGGVNSTFAVNLGSGLAPGASVNLRFLFGVEQPGDYNVAFVLESAPASGKDIWKLNGNTESGGHTDGGCNKPPIANAGLDQTAECVGGQAAVTLDGSGSSDPDNDTPLSYEWKEGASVLGTSQTLGVTLATGSHTVTLKVTDPSGDSAQDTVVVNVTDTQAPQVSAPADVTANTGPGATSCEANVASLGAATAHDDCEGDLAVTATRSDNQPLGAPYPVGTTVVTYSATDGAGHTGTDTQNVTVVDDTKPTVTAPPNKTAANDYGSCSASVDPGTATANDNCGVQSVAGTRSDNQDLNDPYPVGTTTITWTATDIHGNTATATQTVTVQDTQKPSVLATVAVMLMGPPFNHALINVGLSATVTDNCSVGGPAQVKVYSDEDDGAAPHSPDAADIGLGTLKLRRERDGAGNGRVYLIVVKGTDGSGNTAVSCQTVKVPLSNSAADTSSVNAQATAAATFCSANGGAPPPGYFTVGP
ncbi:MAG TPA: Ig-like domain-containing protein [Pyrinomonadaceae bacterium]|jgi:uncharacterized repeat protein (TIGR01451 family)